MIDRFAGADQPDWAAPDEDELLEHFTEHFLTVIPAERIVTTLSSQAALFQDELSVTHATRERVQAWALSRRERTADVPDAPRGCPAPNAAARGRPWRRCPPGGPCDSQR